MKRICLFLGVLAFLYATPSFGQFCGGEFVGQYGTCQSGGCFMQYAKSPSSGDQAQWYHYNFSCCGTVVTGWVNEGTSCLEARLSDKEKSTMELLLSQGIRLMTRDCMGRPVIYTSPAAVMAHNSPPIDLANHDKLYVSELLKEREQ